MRLWLVLAVVLAGAGSPSSTSDDSAKLDAVLRKHFSEASFLGNRLLPVGFSRDGRFAAYGQYGAECVVDKKRGRFFVDDPGPDSEDAVSLYSCRPDAIYSFVVLELRTDRVLPVTASQEGDCQGFTGRQTADKEFHFKECIGIPRKQIEASIEANSIVPDPNLELRQFPLPNGEYTFTVELVSEGANFVSPSRLGKFKTMKKLKPDEELDPAEQPMFERSRVVLRRSDGKLKVLGHTEDLTFHNFDSKVDGYYVSPNANQIAVMVSAWAGDYHGGYTHRTKFFGATLDGRF